MNQYHLSISEVAYPQTSYAAHDLQGAKVYDGKGSFGFQGVISRVSKTSRILLPIGVGLAGSILLSALYLGLVSLAESPQHAIEYFWQDRWIVIPIILGFGVQTGLYVILEKRLFVPVSNIGPSGALTGASGATSTIAMAACCAHHIADLLPILGLTAAATFLAQYRTAFMLVGLGMSLFGITVMLVILFRERRKAIYEASIYSIMETT